MAANKYDANSISILEGLEAVRMRPGMYIGSVGTKGLNHLIYEIADNSVDEHLARFCTQINVTLNDDGTATIKDNGRGIPIGIHPKAGIPRLRLYLQYFMRAVSSEMADIRYQEDFMELVRLLLMHFLYGLRLR